MIRKERHLLTKNHFSLVRSLVEPQVVEQNEPNRILTKKEIKGNGSVRKNYVEIEI